ncbi:MAG: putative peroxiredoxin bcp [Firmicutes bacterium]|nr:putative peroxiredoxin bcp [Bacillota bacterium]
MESIIGFRHTYGYSCNYLTRCGILGVRVIRPLQQTSAKATTVILNIHHLCRDSLRSRRTDCVLRSTQTGSGGVELSLVGQRAPDFTLPGTFGDFSLQEALIKAPLLLIFYPKDDTPG